MSFSNLENSGLLLLLIGSFFFLLMLYFCIQSYQEKEPRAGRIFAWLSIFVPLPYILVAILSFPFQSLISIILIFATIGISLILLIPLREIKKIKIDQPKGRIDERDIMFSRRLLEKGTERHQEYYKQNPENLTPDEIFRQRPGLLNKGSLYYDPVMYASSDASFFTIEQLAPAIDGKPVGNPQHFDESDMTRYVKNWLKKLGALDAGICTLKDYHLYAHGGRKHNYGEKIVQRHKLAIAFTVEMDEEFTSTGPQAPIVMESGQQYLNSGAIAVQLAAFIRNLGHEARAHIDGNYEVICPLIAKDAGLGELGRMGLLMTPTHGPRVRLGVVTTDLPLEVDEKFEDQSIVDFCNRCKKCAEACPSQAISHTDREEIEGVIRWQINQEKCFQYWCSSGTDCGRCMAVCPYSHPNNFMHKVIRFGIQNNFIFRRLALVFDDLIYGRKPKPKPIPEWMIVRKNKF
jgi:reductive dehalogenase